MLQLQLQFCTNSAILKYKFITVLFLGVQKSTKSEDSLVTEWETKRKDIVIDGEERERCETPTTDQNDDEGLRNPWGSHLPSSSIDNNVSDPWADFSQQGKNSVFNSFEGDEEVINTNDPWSDFSQRQRHSFYSSSDSDSEEEEDNKIRFNIKPIEVTGEAATSASGEELQRASASLYLQYTLNIVS